MMPLKVVESLPLAGRIWSMLTPSRLPVVCLVVAALGALYVVRPFSLGFYLDDWWLLLESQLRNGRFSRSMLMDIFDNLPSRPGFDFAAWLYISLLGRSPFLWQAALAASTVAMAWLSAVLASDLNVLGRGAPRFSAAAVLLTFLVAPWAYGFTAWPVMLPTHGAIFFFLASAVLTVRALSRGRVSYAAFPCFVLSCLTYECCYLQFLPLLGLCWVLSPDRFRRRHLLRLGLALVGFCLAQFAADRLKVWLGGSLIRFKAYNPNWLWRTQYNVVQLPRKLMDSVTGAQGLSWYALLALALLFLASFVGIRVRLRQESGLGVGILFRGDRMRAAALAAACAAVLLVGVLLSMFVYALVDYGVEGQGVNSRTTMGITLWLCLLVGLLAGNSAVKETGWRNWLKVSALCLLMVGLGTASYERMRDWAVVWKLEREVLKGAPADEIARIAAPPQDTVIVALVPANEYRGVTIFTNTSDLAAALGVTYPATKCCPPWWVNPPGWIEEKAGRSVRVHYPGCHTTWDGEDLRQVYRGGSKLPDTPTRHVWVWDVGKQQFYQAPPNLVID